jgi:serine-type D-Ala-D-Ala carboxypeptidase/endopeptidase
MWRCVAVLGLPLSVFSGCRAAVSRGLHRQPAHAVEPSPVASEREQSPALPRASERHRADVERLVAPLLAGEFTRSVVIGLLHSESEVYGFGQEHLGRDKAPDSDTLYEIGSVTKVLTGLLLAREVENGALRPDDPLSKLLPQTVRLPVRDGRAITVMDLATHSSGLPRLPTNMPRRDPSNPYADYDAELLYQFLASHELQAAPGTRFVYSNLGMGLLGHALSLHLEQSYEQAVIDRIAAPLGMTRTRVTLSAELADRLADAHDEEGKPVVHWTLGALGGAGAFRSTAFDLLRFLQANLSPADTPLGRALRRSHTQQFADGKERIAYGWDIEQDHYWHNGQTAGHSAFVLWSRAPPLGVVVLAGGQAYVLDELGRRLAQMLRGITPAGLDLPKLVEVDPRDLERLLGVYALDAKTDVTITREADRLYAQGTGQPRFRLYPESSTTFRLRVVDVRVTFELARRAATTLLIEQRGQLTRAKRK